MALTTEEKTKIVFYLGHSAKSIVSGSTHFDGILNKRLENLDQFIEAEAKRLIKNISDVREKLIASQDIMKAKQVGDIVINNEENRLLRRDMKRLCKELGAMLDITCKSGGGAMANVCV